MPTVGDLGLNRSLAPTFEDAGRVVPKHLTTANMADGGHRP